MISIEEKGRRPRNGWKIYAVVTAVLISFLIGLLIGMDTTTVSFKGLPDDAVIHFEVDKGEGAEKKEENKTECAEEKETEVQDNR